MLETTVSTMSKSCYDLSFVEHCMIIIIVVLVDLTRNIPRSTTIAENNAALLGLQLALTAANVAAEKCSGPPRAVAVVVPTAAAAAVAIVIPNNDVDEDRWRVLIESNGNDGSNRTISSISSSSNNILRRRRDSTLLSVWRRIRRARNGNNNNNNFNRNKKNNSNSKRSIGSLENKEIVLFPICSGLRPTVLFPDGSIVV